MSDGLGLGRPRDWPPADAMDFEKMHQELFEKARQEMDAEIAAQEELCTSRVAMTGEESDEDLVNLVNHRLQQQVRLHAMKIDHGFLFGHASPHFGLTW